MIEKVLYKHLQSCVELKPFLTEYAGNRAIFNQEAPADTDPLWRPGSQYARIIIELNMTDDPERGIAGSLNVHYYCEKTEQYPEDVEPVIRPLIDGYFFRSGNITLSADWKTSSYFTTPEEKIVGVSLTYNLIAYPKQATMAPDPIALINTWSSTELSELLDKQLYVIGSDHVPEVFKPDDDHPAIYWRVTGIAKCNWVPDTWAASWQTTSLRGHILTPGNDDASFFIARVIDNVLTNKSRLINDDMSMFVDRNNRINMAADPQRVGQITIDGTYGIPNIQPDVPKMNNISMDPNV